MSTACADLNMRPHSLHWCRAPPASTPEGAVATVLCQPGEAAVNGGGIEEGLALLSWARWDIFSGQGVATTQNNIKNNNQQ